MPVELAQEAERIGRRLAGSDREAVARAAQRSVSYANKERASNVFRRIHFTYLCALSYSPSEPLASFWKVPTYDQSRD